MVSERYRIPAIGDKAFLLLQERKRLIIHGPAGFGKSTLLDALDLRLRQRGSSTLRQGSLPMDDERDAVRLVDGPDASFLTALSARKNRWVVTTRSLASLPIARLRLDGPIGLIGPEDLRSDRAILADSIDRMGVAKARTLDRWSRGWSAAARILSEWMQESNGELDEEGRFILWSGLARYIDDEVFAELDERLDRTALLAAQFDHCTPALLDEMSPAENAGRFVADLVAALQGLVDFAKDGSLEFHPLVRRHLLNNFARLHANQRAELLGRASAACGVAGRRAEAARLAIRSGGDRAAVDYLRREQGLKLWLTGGFDVIKLLAEGIGSEALQREPRMRLFQAIVDVKEGRLAAAEQNLAETLPLLADDPAGLRDAEVVRMTLLVYGCQAAREEDFDRFRRIVMRKDDDPAWKAYLMTLRCILQTQAGDLKGAASRLVAAEEYSHAAESHYNLLFLDIHAANIAIARGHIDQARRAIARSRNGQRARFGGDVGVETVISAASANIEYEAGRMANARAQLRRSAHRMPHAEAWFDIYAAAYEPYFRLLAEEIGLEAALERLGSVQEELADHNLPRIASLLGALANCLIGEARLRGRAAPDLPASERPGEWVAWQERELVTLAGVYDTLAAGDTDAALNDLASLVHEAEQRDLGRTRLRAMLLTVAALDQAGRKAEADSVFDEAFALALTNNAARTLVDFGGDAVSTRLTKAMAKSTAMAASLRSRLKTQLKRRGERPHTPHITPREYDVLRYLEAGLADKVIGRRLGISEHGVRYHLKNLYRKLRVHDRRGAVERAHVLSLFAPD